MSEIRYTKFTLIDGTRLILRITRESPRFVTGIIVDSDGEEIVPRGVNPEGRRYHQTEQHVQRTSIKKAVEMRMNNKYATLEPVARANGSATAKIVNIVTDTTTLADAMFPGGGLAAYNEGFYQGTTIPIRKLTGREIVTVAGTTTGAKVVTDQTWVTDRFGPVGARQIRRLRALTKAAGQ